MKRIQLTLMLFLLILGSCSSEPITTYENNQSGFDLFLKAFILKSKNHDYLDIINQSDFKHEEIEIFYLEDDEDLRKEDTHYWEEDTTYEYLIYYHNQPSNSDYIQSYYFQYSLKLETFVLIDYGMTVG